MELKKLLRLDNGDYLLTDQKNQALTCPYQNAILLPGSIQGQLTLNRPPCGSQCSLFEISPSEFEGKLFLKKHCCGENEKLLAVEDQGKKSALKLS